MFKFFNLKNRTVLQIEITEKENNHSEQVHRIVHIMEMKSKYALVHFDKLNKPLTKFNILVCYITTEQSRFLSLLSLLKS